MASIRRRLLAVAVTMSAVFIVAPVSGASAAFTPIGVPAAPGVGTQGNANLGGCGNFPQEGQGPAGSVTPLVCGNLLAFVGPMVGQISSAVGPTIIGSTVLAPVTTSNGPVAAGSVP